MYTYALLDSDGVCHTVYQTSEELSTPLPSNTVNLSSYDTGLLESRWTGSVWDYRPSVTHRWNSSTSQWEDTIFDIDYTISDEDKRKVAIIAGVVLKEYKDNGQNTEDATVEAAAIAETKARFQTQEGRAWPGG